MSDLYSRIESRCKDRGITITKMCAESGASRASLTDLKVGRKKTLSAKTLTLIASYFGCAVDDLLRDETKKAPTVTGERQGDTQQPRDARTAIMVEMFEQLSQQDQNEVIAQLLLKVRSQEAQDDHR